MSFWCISFRGIQTLSHARGVTLACSLIWLICRYDIVLLLMVVLVLQLILSASSIRPRYFSGWESGSSIRPRYPVCAVVEGEAGILGLDILSGWESGSSIRPRYPLCGSGLAVVLGFVILSVVERVAVVLGLVVLSSVTESIRAAVYVSTYTFSISC